MSPLLREASAIWLALVFAAAALSKFQAWSAWPGVVTNFRVLPRALVLPVAWALPPLEAAVAAGLLVAAVRPLAGLAAALLLVAFSAALALNLARGRTSIDCGCFRSDLRQSLAPSLLVRNAALVAAALALVPAGEPTALSGLEYAIAGGAGLSLFFCYLSVGLVFPARTAAAVQPA